MQFLTFNFILFFFNFHNIKINFDKINFFILKNTITLNTYH